MESAEKGGRMSSPHVDEEKREKLRYIKGKRKRKRGWEAEKKKKDTARLFFGIWNLPTLKPSILA